MPQAQLRAGGAQRGFVALAAPESFQRGLEFAAGADAWEAEDV
jgi:hypothetical protein